jgi:hypothetical protein
VCGQPVKVAPLVITKQVLLLLPWMQSTCKVSCRAAAGAQLLLNLIHVDNHMVLWP